MNDKFDNVSGQMRAELLAETLPYMQRYANKSIVLKYGGHAMGDSALSQAFCQDVALLKQSGINIAVVHGGGPQIEKMLQKIGIKSKFRSGLRITDEATVEVVEMVLAGSINKQIVATMNQAGVHAIGLCGKDGNMVLAEKVTRTFFNSDSKIEQLIDFGFVGKPKTVNREVIDMVISAGLIPVIAPVCFGADGKTYNVNADTFAGALASALFCTRFLLLTDVPGVLDENGNLIRELSVSKAKKMIADGTISGGMIPKIKTCIEAIAKGVDGVVILNGKMPHAVLSELFTEYGSGTLIVK